MLMKGKERTSNNDAIGVATCAHIAFVLQILQWRKLSSQCVLEKVSCHGKTNLTKLCTHTSSF